MPEWTGWKTRKETHYGDRVIDCFVDRPLSLQDMVARAGAERGDHEALIFEEQRLTWNDVIRQSGALATGLQKLGITKGDRVVLHVGNCVEVVIAMYAVARLGAIAVPVSARERGPGLRYIVEHSGAACMFIDGETEAALDGEAPISTLHHRIDVRSAAYTSMLDHEIATPADRGEEEIAVILYTSGTTGTPKGAMISNLNLVHSAMNFVECLGLGPEDRILMAVPVSHVTGTIALVATTALARGCLVVMDHFRAEPCLKLAAKERISFTVMVPAMYNLLLLRPEFAQTDLSHWRVGGYGGSVMPQVTIEKLAAVLPKMQLVNAYGATETTSPSTIQIPSYALSHRDTVGVPAPNARIIVMDDNGREVPRGETGELWISGPMVVPGYWRNPEATAREFTGGYWHSGDIGSIDADGFVRVLDRKKDMVNRGGYKIYSAEVESVLVAHDAVLEAAIVAKPCPVLGERVHAFVVHKPEHPNLTEETLAEYARSQLADYKRPETWSLRSEPLPRNANGKVVKRALRDLLGV